jgi:hypothetical protein
MALLAYLAQLREVSETNRVHPIVVYSDFKGRPAAEILRLSQLGIAHVISQDIDDKVTEIRAMLSGALRGTARSRIFAALEEHICPDAAVLLHEMWVVGNSSGAAGCSGCLHRPG